jgi:hypothetical protein
VEGAEGLVLEGARNVLNTLRPVVVLEWYADFLRPFGTSPDALLAFARDYEYLLFSVPGGVAVDSSPALRVQMMTCSNFLLLPR